MEQFKEKCIQYLLGQCELRKKRNKKFKSFKHTGDTEESIKSNKTYSIVAAVGTLICFVVRFLIRKFMEGHFRGLLSFVAMVAGILALLNLVIGIYLLLLNMKTLKKDKTFNEKLRREIDAHKAEVAKLEAESEAVLAELAEERKKYPELADRKCFFDTVEIGIEPPERPRNWVTNECGVLNMRLFQARGRDGTKYNYQDMYLYGSYRKGKSCLISEILPYFDPSEYYILYRDEEYIKKNPEAKCSVWELMHYTEELYAERLENSNAFSAEKTLEIIESNRSSLEAFLYSGLGDKPNLSTVPEERCDSDSYEDHKLVTADTWVSYQSKELHLHRYGYVVRTPDRSRVLCVAAPRRIPAEYQIAFNFGEKVSSDDAYGYWMGKVIGLSYDDTRPEERVHLPYEVMQKLKPKALVALDVLSPVPEGMSNRQWINYLSRVAYDRYAQK